MIKVSNYYVQSIGLPMHNSYQLRLLQWADASTLLRETSKIGTVVGLVSSAAGVIFNFDPTVAIACTAVSGTAWVLFSTCARQLEPEACKTIKYLKDVKDGKE
jgi:hypothetical protein